MKLIIGSHVSYNNDFQLLGCVHEALSYGANSFMFYTGSNISTTRLPINEELTIEAHNLMKKSGIDMNNIIIHAPYIINLANDTDLRKYDFYISFLKQELKRCKEYGFKNLVFHPGSSVTLSKKQALENIVFGINKVMEGIEDINLLIEFMSGKGTEVGSSIEEIKYIISNVEKKNQLFVCLDTCHMNDSGIDISKFDEFLDEFDREIGISKIKCIHINDSYNEIGVKKDRHANIGYGKIGFDNLISVIYNKRIESIPKILETPYINRNSKESYSPYKFEIDMIMKKTFIDFINQ